jgi:hypothetical protein
MIWQDIVASIASVIFIYAMMPQIIYGFKTRKGLIALQFSVINIIAMTGLVVVYFSLELYAAFVMNVVLIILWIILVFQRLEYGRVKK